MVLLLSKFRSVTFILLSVILVANPSLAQQSPKQQSPEQPAAESDETKETPNEGINLEQKKNQDLRADNLLSLQGGEKLMQQANQAIDEQDYDTAQDKLKSARQVFNQLSNLHQQLAKSFQGINNRISKEQRSKAVESGNKRDQATFQLALVHRAKQEPALAIPLLIQVVRSQNPDSELGKKAYKQLQELGFVETPLQGN